MVRKTTVAIRFTQEIADVRRTGFVNDLSRLILDRLKGKRPEALGNSFRMQWFRLPNQPLLFCVNVWGEHETAEVRSVVSEIAAECIQKSLPVTLDIIME